MKTWTIYKITGNCGRAYVGLTSRKVIVRWANHIRDAANGSETFLHRAMRKYGVGWFSVATLCECYSKREAVTAERALIAAHNTYAHAGSGFNLTYGGDGNWGWKPSHEVRAKIGAKSAERMAANPEYVRKMVDGHNSSTRKRPSNSARAAEMGRSKKGTKLSPEHAAKVRVQLIGRPKSDETLAKMRSTRPKGEWKPPQGWVDKMIVSKRHRGWCRKMYQLALNKRGENARFANRRAA